MHVRLVTVLVDRARMLSFVDSYGACIVSGLNDYRFSRSNVALVTF